VMKNSEQSKRSIQIDSSVATMVCSTLLSESGDDTETGKQRRVRHVICYANALVPKIPKTIESQNLLKLGDAVCVMSATVAEPDKW